MVELPTGRSFNESIKVIKRKHQFIPAITGGHVVNNLKRELIVLPPSLDGLGSLHKQLLLRTESQWNSPHISPTCKQLKTITTQDTANNKERTASPN